MASVVSQAVMVIMRSPMVAPTQLINPGIASISIATFRALSLTSFRSSSVRASSQVMLKAPGVAVFPLEARVATPNPKGPMALG
jgi:hypothetical protein